MGQKTYCGIQNGYGRAKPTFHQSYISQVLKMSVVLLKCPSFIVMGKTKVFEIVTKYALKIFFTVI